MNRLDGTEQDGYTVGVELIHYLTLSVQFLESGHCPMRRARGICALRPTPYPTLGTDEMTPVFGHVWRGISHVAHYESGTANIVVATGQGRCRDILPFAHSALINSFFQSDLISPHSHKHLHHEEASNHCYQTR